MADGLIAVRFLSTLMLIWKLPSAAASQVSVTNAAATLPALIATAASAAFPIPDTVDTAVIVPENGQVRVMFDGNTPTASLGILLSSGVPYTITGVSLSQIRLISVSGSNVAVSVQVGQQNDDEQPLIAAGGSSGSSAVTTPAAPSSTLSSNLPVAQYNTTAPTATNGQVVANQADQYGNQKVAEAYLPYGSNSTLLKQEVISGKATKGRITTATTTVAKSGACSDLQLVFETVPTGPITVYDNTAASGTIVTIIPVAFAQPSITLENNFSIGCTIVTAAADRVAYNIA